MMVQAVSAVTSEMPAAVPLAVVPAADVIAIDAGPGGRTISIPPPDVRPPAAFPPDPACCLFLRRIRFFAVTKMRQ